MVPRRLIVMAAVAWCLCCSPSHLHQPAASRTAPAPGEPRFDEAACAFTVPVGASARCGWLTVPEDRAKPGGRRIRLHVAIYKSRSRDPLPDPILWLVGGPGGRGHRVSSNMFERVVEPFLGHRDFIVVDVRGTGYSQPALDCPDTSGPASRWLPACRERLARVADLSAYNGAAVAADLADLRRALSLRQWNLFGESHGTRLALQAMRDHPEGIRAVILDAVSPPEVDSYADGPGKFDHALGEVFRDCGSDPSCNAAFPRLRETLLDAAARLDQSPRRLAGVWRNTPFETRFDGAQLMKALHMALYESDVIPQIPRAIYGAVDGSADQVWSEVIGRHAVGVATRLVDQGAHLSFTCSEEAPFTDVGRLSDEDQSRPWMRHAASGLLVIESCRLWLGTRAGDPREARPVRSDIPVLLLSGQYDPVTPAAYAESAARHLSRAHVFVMPGLGHWLTANPVTSCPQQIALEFLDDPARRPGAACIREWTPRWAVR